MKLISLLFILFSSSIVLCSEPVDSILVCQYWIKSKEKIELDNYTEYQLENGITFIRNYFSDGKIKNESFWINSTIPVLDFKEYNTEGKLVKTIEKGIEPFNLCDVFNVIYSRKEFNKNTLYVTLSRAEDLSQPDMWSVCYESECGFTDSKGKYIIFNPKTGESSFTESQMSYQPVDLPDTNDEYRPSYKGGFMELRKYIQKNINEISDSLINVRIYVSFNVDFNGEVSDLRIIRGSSNEYLNQKILKIFDNMPDWNPALKKESYKKYSYTIPVNIRKFE
jgi:hypothetical protein